MDKTHSVYALAPDGEVWLTTEPTTEEHAYAQRDAMLMYMHGLFGENLLMTLVVDKYPREDS